MKMAKWMAAGTVAVNAISLIILILSVVFQKNMMAVAEKIGYYFVTDKTMIPVSQSIAALLLLAFSIALLGATIFTEKENRSLRVVAAIGIFSFTLLHTVVVDPLIQYVQDMLAGKMMSGSNFAAFNSYIGCLDFFYSPAHILGAMLIAAVCGMLLFYKREEY